MTSPVARTVRRHPLVTFFALAFGIAWAFVPFAPAAATPQTAERIRA